jgi:hypothetical protein
MKKFLFSFLLISMFFPVLISAGYRTDSVGVTAIEYFGVGSTSTYVKAAQSFVVNGSYLALVSFRGCKVGSPGYTTWASLRSIINTPESYNYHWYSSDFSTCPVYSWMNWWLSPQLQFAYGQTKYFVFETSKDIFGNFQWDGSNYYSTPADTSVYSQGNFYYTPANIPYSTRDLVLDLTYQTMPVGTPCQINADCDSNLCYYNVCFDFVNPWVSQITPNYASQFVSKTFYADVDNGTFPLSCIGFDFGDGTSWQTQSISSPGTYSTTHSYAEAFEENARVEVCDNQGGVCNGDLSHAGCWWNGNTISVYAAQTPQVTSIIPTSAVRTSPQMFQVTVIQGDTSPTCVGFNFGDGGGMLVQSISSPGTYYKLHTYSSSQLFTTYSLVCDFRSDCYHGLQNGCFQIQGYIDVGDVNFSNPSCTAMSPYTSVRNAPQVFSSTVVAGDNPLSCVGFHFGDGSAWQVQSISGDGVYNQTHNYTSAGDFTAAVEACDNQGGTCTGSLTTGCTIVTSVEHVYDVYPSPSPSVAPSSSPTPTVTSTPTAPVYCNSTMDCDYAYNCNTTSHSCYPRSQNYQQWGLEWVGMFFNFSTMYLVYAGFIILICIVAIGFLKNVRED